MNDSSCVARIRAYVKGIEDMEVPKTKQAISAALHSPTSRLSHFEVLPLEIRQIMYGLLGFPVCRQIDRSAPVKPYKREWFKATVTRFEFMHWHTSLADNLFDNGLRISYQQHPLLNDHYIRDVQFTKKHKAETALLFVNKNIRTELIDLVLSRVEVAFGFQLSDKPIHFSKPYNGATNWSITLPKGYYRMRMLIEDFQHLTKVVLTVEVGYSCSTNRPHRLRMISARQILAKQALSVRFVASHCSHLVTFEMTPYLQGCFGSSGYRPLKTKPRVAEKAVLPVLQALMYMAAECKSLELIRMPRAISHVIGGWIQKDRWPYLYGVVWHEVSLREMTPWAREDAVEEWAKRTLHLLRTEGPVSDTAML